MPLHDFFAEGQADAGAVVAHGESPSRSVRLGLDMDQRLLGAVELDGVADQVLEELDQLTLVGQHARQRGAGDDGAVFLDRYLKIDKRLSQNVIAVDGREGFAFAAKP